MKLSVKSIDKTISTGVVAQKDLLRDGYISVNFYKSKNTIGVEIAGFSNGSISYYLNPINQKQKISNDIFISRYIDKCQNSDDIKIQLGLK